MFHVFWDTRYICSASAQKAELKVVGVRTWGGQGVSVLVCTQEAAFEMEWWKSGGVSVDTILLTFLSTPACTACTDMVYLKYLERDVTSIAMAKAIE